MKGRSQGLGGDGAQRYLLSSSAASSIIYLLRRLIKPTDPEQESSSSSTVYVSTPSDMTQVVQVDLGSEKSHKTQQPPKAASLLHASKIEAPPSPMQVIITPATELPANAVAGPSAPPTPKVDEKTQSEVSPVHKLPPCPIALLRAAHLLALQSTIIRMKKERADYRLGWSCYRNYSEMIEELEKEADGVRRAQEDLDRFPSVVTPIVLKTMSGPKTRNECEADDVKRLSALHLWVRPVKNGPLTKQQAGDFEKARKMLKQIPAGIEDSWTFMYDMEMRRHMGDAGKPPFGLQPKKPRMIGPMNLDQALRHDPVIRELPFGPITKEVAQLLAKLLPKKLNVEIPARLALLKFPEPEAKPKSHRSHSGRSRKTSSAKDAAKTQRSEKPQAKLPSSASTSSEVDVDFLKDLQASPPDRPALIDPAQLPSHLPKKPMVKESVSDGHLKSDDGLSWLQVPYAAYPAAIAQELRAIRHADGLSWMKMPYREFGRDVEAKLRKVRRQIERMEPVKTVV